MSEAQDQFELLKRNVGHAVAAARAARGWSQAYVAKQLDVDSETISRIERGHTVKLDRLLVLATLFEIPLATFFVDAPGAKVSSDEQITLMLGMLDTQNKERVMQMARAIVDAAVR